MNPIHYTETIYHYSEKVEKEKISIKINKNISERNKEFILQFCRDRQIKKGFSSARILKLLNKLKLIAYLFKVDFNKATKEDIDTFLEIITTNQKLSKATKVDYFIILKVFYKWLLGEDKKYPSLVDDIKTTLKKKERLPSEILTEEEVNILINSTINIRDKAVISILSDSGCRVGELISLRLRDIKFNENDNTIRLLIETGKTGGRSLILIPSVPFLSNYINSIPNEIKNNPNNFLFLRMNQNFYFNEQMTYPSVRALLKKTGKRANIQKGVNPHAFRRHSATTSSSFMTDTQLMLRYGWSRRNTVDSYTFMNPTQADQAYMSKYGKQTLESKESKLMPLRCSCGTFNPLDSICVNCGKPNSLKVVIKKDNEEQQALQKLKEAVLILSENINDEARIKLAEILK
ncbi:MAG TPA: hypothetical protein DCY48_02960 [Candidatus Magasanikbacteria bacterium]|nr:tyrosine-type recombinase/integrase [Candidatus Woesearchaeota archaeon]HAZ28710.1 hypothetical protein [Candidatus Magasanikbacteria bacterium]